MASLRFYVVADVLLAPCRGVPEENLVQVATIA